ncbi:uncharacterized protein LOC144709470 isoform X2 [Wolffia australiana]
MASVAIDVAGEQTATQNCPSSPSVSVEIPTEETKNLPLEDVSNTPVLPSQQIVSIDVFRGFATVILILVVDAGGAFPSISASPWTGLTLGDLKVPDRKAATIKAVKRAILLFVLGLFFQGGYFHGRGDDTYGVDLDRIRLFGILQGFSARFITPAKDSRRRANINRIFLSGMTVVWLDNDGIVDSPSSFARRYYPEWVVALALCSIYMGFSNNLYVPDWEFHVLKSEAVNRVSCGVRGSLSPSCTAAGLIDRFFLGEKHLNQRPSYARMKECSIRSPASGPLPSDAPVWCQAPFDPEGLLSSFTAVVTCFIGLNFGHVYTNSRAHGKTLITWLNTSLVLVIVGLVMKTLGLPFNRSLYTVSFLCVSSGICGIVLTALYYIVDVKEIMKPVLLLKWIGKNVLIVYALSALQVCSIVLQGFYWRSPENNPVDRLESGLQALFHSTQWGTFVFVLVEIIFWGLFSGFLHRKRIYL